MYLKLERILDIRISIGRKRSNCLLYIFLLLMSPLFLISCLEEPDHSCPPEYMVAVGVLDKNYANANGVPGIVPKDEQLPFKAYVGDLAYRLEALATGSVVKDVAAYAVVGNGMFENLYLPEIQAGRYVLTAFGNTSHAADENGGILSYNLHPDGQEDADVYLVCDTLDFSPDTPNPTVDMVRTKGGLYILIENLPDSVVRIDQQVSTVYQHVDRNSHYSGETTVVKSFTSGLHPSAMLLTVLAPTVAGKNSNIRLALYTQGATTPFMFIPDFSLFVKRNEVTAFKLNFKPDGGVEVWIGFAGEWTKLHDMDIVVTI